MASAWMVHNIRRSQSNGNRLLSGAGAAVGLLLPKCPLCWMALSGSFVAAGYTMWSFEAGGLVLFLYAFWRMLRRNSQRTFATVCYLLLAASVAACGAWLAMPAPLRLTLWITLMLGAFWISAKPIAAKCACKPVR